MAKRENAVTAASTDWDAILPPIESGFGPSIHETEISFANSRPAGDGFPLAQFRRLSKQVIDGPDAAEILQSVRHTVWTLAAVFTGASHGGRSCPRLR